MPPRSLVCISDNPDLTAAAVKCADRSRSKMIAASDPEAMAGVLYENLSSLSAVIVDFDSGSFAGAWVRALGTMGEPPLIVAVSVYHPRFLEAAAHSESIRQWLRMPVTCDDLMAALGVPAEGEEAGHEGKHASLRDWDCERRI